MNKFAGPLIFTSATKDSAPETLTLEALKKTVGEIKAKYPFVGMEPMESRWLPEGVTALVSPTQIALCKDGKVVVIDKQDIFKSLPPTIPKY